MYRPETVVRTGIIFLVIGIGYAGFRLNAASHGLEQYRRIYGYQTPTTGLTECVFENPAWKAILIDSDITCTDGAHNLRPFDIDGDGDPELVANSYRADTLMVCECESARMADDARAWTRHVIDSRVGGGLPRRPAGTFTKAFLKRTLMGNYIEGAHYTAIADLSGDGVADLVVAGDLTRYDVVWYEAACDPCRKTRSWTKHIAYRNDSHRTYYVETGDIDSDGDTDIVFTTKTDNSLGWLENRGASQTWPAVMVDVNCIRCFYARVVDIDNNGTAEILASEDDSDRYGKVCLYARSGHPRDARNWRKHHIAHLPAGHGISVFTVLDLEGDGNLDVAGAGHQGDVCVLKNPWPGDVHRPWDMHFVVAGRTDMRRSFREIDVGDLDLDGDPDIVVADERQNAVLWFENPGTAFCGAWEEHVVDQSDVYLRWCHSVRMADIDKDGDLDLAVAAAASNVFLLYLNQVRGAQDIQPAILASAE